MPIVGSSSLFIVKVQSTFLGETMLNRFWYQAGVAPGTISVASLVTEFETQVSSTWADAVSTAWDGDRISIDEVTSLENFIDTVCTIGPGLRTGESMGPFMAMAIRLFRSTKETRSGWKRIAGVVELDQENGALTPAHLVILNALAADFKTVLTVDTNGVFPVIVRKTYSGTPPELEEPSNWIYNVISQAAGLSNLTTQNTRKFGA